MPGCFLAVLFSHAGNQGQVIFTPKVEITSPKCDLPIFTVRDAVKRSTGRWS